MRHKKNLLDLINSLKAFITAIETEWMPVMDKHVYKVMQRISEIHISSASMYL